MEAMDEGFWNEKYINNQTGWDLGQVSPPIKKYIDQLENKKIKILIPGAGNSYEAQYLLQNGFSDITIIDIAPKLVEELNKKWGNNPNIKITQGDFFELTGSFDLIIEQTFFCAIHPAKRKEYVEKMSGLLNDNGLLVGLLFDREFEGGPPFGGLRNEYVELFEKKFELHKFERAYNSIEPRLGKELWINCQPL